MFKNSQSNLLRKLREVPVDQVHDWGCTGEDRHQNQQGHACWASYSMLSLCEEREYVIYQRNEEKQMSYQGVLCNLFYITCFSHQQGTLFPLQTVYYLYFLLLITENFSTSPGI